MRCSSVAHAGAVALAVILASVSRTTAGAPALLYTVYQSDHAHGLPTGWAPYDNWGKPELSAVASGPLGPSARVTFDDTSTAQHFDKGIVVQMPAPVAWTDVDFVRARYHVDRPVANIRLLVHCDRGGWWDYTDTHPVIGVPATVAARADDFHLAWTDDPSRPGPDKTGRIIQVFVAVHNARPVNSGERFVLFVADLRLGTELLPVANRIRTDRPPLAVWPIARSAGAWNTAVCVPVGGVAVQAALDPRTSAIRLRVDRPGVCSLTINGTQVALRSDAAHRASVGVAPAGAAALPGPIAVSIGSAAWNGVAIAAPALTSGDALALSARTGAVRWRPAGRPLVGSPVRFDAGMPGPWAALPDRRWLTGVDGARVPVAAPEAGDYTAERSVATTPPVTLAAAVTVPEVDPAAMRRALPAAEARAAALARRIAAGHRETWWAARPAETAPAIRDRRPVDPKRWSLIKDPVTREDLDGGFVGAVQCGLSEEDLDLYCKHYDFGRLVKPHLSTILDPQWDANIRRAADRDLLVGSVWGYVPDAKWNGGFGEVSIPEPRHRAILGILGRRFLGYEMGEQDGRYIGGYAPAAKPANRADARRLFEMWHRRISTPLHDRMVALGSLNFSHEYGRMSERMLGLETAQGLPSDIMEWAFLRGASKQYGALTWNCISVFNRWGYKSYTSTGDDHGPDKGTSVELMKRLWYVTWLYGSAANAFEGAYTRNEKDGSGHPLLSPVGQTHVDAVRFARRHADRGVLYTPVAVMLDRDAGWAPPRHLYTDARNLVWGNIPYARADFAADAFFRWIWPHYEDASYYPDERGFLTNTPLGDQFDVILSDATDACLRRYQTLILIGVTHVDRTRLARFVAGGGEIVVSASTDLGPALQGVAIGQAVRRAQRSILCADGSVAEETPYTYRLCRRAGARALALSEHGDGILWEHRSGKGRVITCALPDFVTAEADAPQPGVDVPLRRALLHGFQRAMTPYLRSLSLIDVAGPPLQVLCGVDQDPKRLIVSLVNHSREPAEATVSRRQGAFARVSPWMGQAEIHDGRITTTVPPLDTVIFETWAP